MSENFVPESQITDDDRLWAMLAYIFSPLIPIVIMLMDEKKDRPFIKAHNVQALIWGIIGYAVSSLLSFVFFIGCVVWIAYIIITIIWAMKANKGELVEIPVITKLVKDQGWA
ncbi:MAG: DUF4870 domain-containing protein [Anaerolineaceae bacterium]|jgi:uncharacterized membrane protein|nr:DUF4870 domain-containing protein [Anaerolineaceae bacterium]